ncbi:unnamed protein product [Rotaria sp. Silwood1]|nr:unnamed protein product [Rotaria sp. Silwood1]CAF4533389.1 unnamed protein product [Rotaria sp. Silwood1]
MSYIGFNRHYINFIYYLLLIFLLINLSFNSLITIHEINQVIFLNPQTNITLIRCPLNHKHEYKIQWYDVINNRYENVHEEYYRIYGLQPYDREFICSSISQTGIETNEKYKIKLRIFDRPLPIRHISIKRRTNTSLTLQWKDDSYNRNANITYYDLILKLNNTIQFRIFVNHTQLSYTFSSLYSNTFYSIDISAVDIWKRHSQKVTITTRTLSSKKNENISSHQLIDRHLLDESISCYRLNHQLLLIEFNRSKFLMQNLIYNLTIYNDEDHIVLSDNLYSSKQQLPIIKTLNSFIYNIRNKNLRCKIKLIVSTIQLEFLGTTYKYCEDFYPIYSPLTCSIKLINQHKSHLMINIHLHNNHKQIMTLKPNYIFYQKNQNQLMKKNIYDIQKYVTADIFDVKENYSIMVENNLIGSNKSEKLNISILCSINRLAPINRNNRISNSIIISLIVLSIILTALVFVIAYQRGLMSTCYRVLLHHINSLRKNHHPRPCFVQINNSTNENVEKNVDINYEEFDTISIPINQFPAYVKNMHKNNDFGFIRLFENICDLSKTYNFSADISQFEHNQCKNRYINILTYDHSRVKLSTDENDGKENYINANYVDGFHKTNAYIATQGPMMNTINDFWRMIWEKNVRVLVMITNVKECGRIKCDVYWPLDDTETYGTIQVTLINTISLAYYVKRIFSIRCETNQKLINSERFVYQFHFTDWPDHGVPLFTLPVLSFIRHSSSCNTETDGPIVVHCSAGVGRTGTYIVIDTMLKKLNEQQSINIPSFLKHIRQQRNFLVQTEEQFIFIYDVLFEAAQLSIIGYNNLELNKNNIDYIIKTLNTYDKDSNLTRIEKQFQLIIEQIKAKHQQVSVGHLEENLAKNRTQAILPLNLCRVILSTDRKQTGGSYINASYIHGYYCADQFIITQHPMMNTIVDFWQMIWNTNATIIVSLYADEKLQFDVPDFWPLVNQIMNCGDFIVCLTNEHFEYEYIYRDFSLQSIQENYELKVKLVSCTYWPETCSPIKTSFNLINTIRNFKSKGPIVVHDFFGGHRAATFCALYTMSEQIEIEGILNVYELAKFYYLKRPGIWRHHGDLLHLYRCAEILFHEYKLSNYNHRCLSTLPL